MTEQLEAPPTPEPAAQPTPHPVLDFALRGRARLDHLTTPAARPVWAMTTDELRTSLLELTRLGHQVEALRLSVLAEAERTGTVADAGDRTAADWAARHTGQRRHAARADLRLALALDADHQALGAAFARGEVSGAQVRAITRSLDLLPAAGEFAVSAEQRNQAEAHLVALAATHDATELEILGRRIYAVVCPEAADAYEGRLLEAEEARAARRVTLEVWTDHQGITHGRFRIPKLHGAMLKKALDALMSPARGVSTSSTAEVRSTTDTPVEPVETTSRDDRPLPVRRGAAFCELLERLRADNLPTTGGGDATIAVIIELEDLTAALDAAGVATLDTGHRISASEARRLACRHRLLPAVLDGKSQVLDLGRTQRLHTKAQRLAMAIRDGGCTAEHCTAPAAMCHAHHDQPWSEGGTTTLETGRLLCGPHHRRVHDPAYWHERLPDGKVRFHRRI